MIVKYTAPLAPLGLPIGWDGDGNVFGLENLTPEQNATLDAAIAAYDPVKDNEKQSILDELAQLDLVLPRAVEDLVEAMQILASLPGIMQQRIARKSELRNKLKELS